MDEELSVFDLLYCDYCEVEGHTFQTCPRRDDNHDPEPDDHTDIE